MHQHWLTNFVTPVRAKKGNIGRGMSTSAKDNFRKEKSKKGTWSRWIKTTSASILSYGQQGMSFAWGTSRFIGWIVLTTSFLTLLPLVLEVKREEKVEEMEQLQIRAMMAEGTTPQELAANGLTSAIQPSVLKKD